MRTRPCHDWNEAQQQFYPWTFVDRDAHRLLIDHSKLSSIYYFSGILLGSFFTAVITFWKRTVASPADILRRASRVPSPRTREARLRMSARKATTTVTAMKTSLKKRIRAEIWYFHVLFGQRWQRNVQKSMLHVRSSVWFCLSKLTVFVSFSLPSPSSLLKLP